MRSILVSILAFCFLLVSGIAFCADSTAFDPTLVAVKAKGAGGVPVGTIISWPVATDPEDMDNWLECNGQSISQSAYPELFAVVGNQVPDLRGLFLRGYGSQAHTQNNGSAFGITSTTHSSGELGHVQGDSTRNATGRTGGAIGGGAGALITNSGVVYWVQGANHFGAYYSYIDFSRALPTANEIRPVNRAVRYLIRARQ